MCIILRDDKLKQFIKENNISYDEEIFSIILDLSKSEYIINGYEKKKLSSPYN